MSIVKLSLSGGSGGGTSSSKTYTAPNGVICTSDVTMYDLAGYYYLKYLFDNVTTAGTYTMGNGDSSRTSPVIIMNLKAANLTNLSYVNVYPWYRSDTSSNFQVWSSDDGVNWNDESGVVSTVSAVNGQAFRVDLNLTDPQYLKVKLIYRSGTWCGGATEIDLYYDDNIAPIVVATGITLNKSTSTIARGNNDILLATVIPSNVTNSAVTWASNNSSIASVDSTGLVTSHAKGSCTITATTTDGSNKTASCSVTVNVLATDLLLNKTDDSIGVGATDQLTATITPSDVSITTASWSSSNPGIASVSSSGLITGIAAGTCVITATTKDSTNISKTCNVTVSITMTGITLNKNSITIHKSNTETLIATISPSTVLNKTVTWSSSNTTVATVNNGVVTAVKAGTCIITVTTQDGAFSASCNVTVDVPVIGIALNKKTDTLAKSSADQLVAVILPEDATDKVITWSSSDPSIASVNANGNVLFIKEGNCTITVTTHDGNYTDTCEITVRPAAMGISNIRLQLIGKMLDGSAAGIDILEEAVWSVSDPTVAMIENGYLVPLTTRGLAIVTATIGSLTASATVVIGELMVETITTDTTKASGIIGSKFDINIK